MKSCKLFKCEFWNDYVCCTTCPKKDLPGQGRCSKACQNEPSKCGSYIPYEVGTVKRDAVRERARKHYYDNIEKCKEQHRKWYQENKERVSEYQKIYRTAHREELIARQSEWRERKKAENPNYNKEYRARLKLKKQGEVHSAES